MPKVSYFAKTFLSLRFNLTTCFFADSLKGVRYRNETVHDTLSKASMAGGMELFIDGSGMDEQPQLNSIIFQSTQTASQAPIGPP